MLSLLRWIRHSPGWRLSPLAVLGLIVVVAGVSLAGGIGFWATVEHTSELEFCVSCHSMQIPYKEYQASVHASNASGVRAVCADCHVPRAVLPKLWAKMLAVNDVIGEIRGTIDTPEKYEAKRLELAKVVWARMEATDSRECRSCHVQSAMDIHKQTKPGVEQMQAGLDKGQTCIDCHKGIAHHLPDMASGYKASAQKLQAAAEVLQPRVGATVYPLTTVNFYLDKPQGDAAHLSGKLLAATPLKVLAQDGPWLQVEAAGWQQQGAQRVVYAQQGKRILEAALSPPAVARLAAGQATQDADTGQTWTQVTLTAWIRNAQLTGDLAALWDYGAQMFNANCGSCHALPETQHYLANQWIGTLNAMRSRTPLDDEQFRFLQKYVQMHAHDTGAGK